MTDHLPYDREEFHSDFDLWSDNHVKPDYLSVHNDPITPDEEALLTEISEELINGYPINHADPRESLDKTIGRIADLLEFIRNYRQRTRIAIRDAKYAARNQIVDVLGKMEDDGQKDTEAYQKLRQVWLELSE